MCNCVMCISPPLPSPCAPGETHYNLKGEVLDRPVFYMGEDWEAHIVERMCKFTVNGMSGWGISEWDYRSVTMPGWGVSEWDYR